MQALGEWFQNIILAVLLATFLEMILPNSSMERYVRLVLSLMVLMAILSPLLALFSGHWGDEQWLQRWWREQEQSFQHSRQELNSAAILAMQQQQSEQLAKAELGQLIQAEADKWDLVLEDLSITWADRQRWEVKQLVVVLAEEAEKGEVEEVQGGVYIQPIRIEVNLNDDPPPMELPDKRGDTARERQLRRSLAQQLQLEERRLVVRIVERAGG